MENKINDLFNGAKCISYSFENDILNLILESTQKENVCPYCGSVSSRVHSYHIRKFNDLPIDGYKVSVTLYNKKFFCINKACKHTTFSEVFDFIKPLEMKTTRLINKILEISENNSSRKATSLLKDFGVSTCKATICNLKNKK